MKPHLNLEQQLDLLISRGLVILDPDEFLVFLATQNYYRLRGYFHPFLVEENGTTSSLFKAGTEARTIQQLVEFDRRLRNLLFEALAVYETQFRAILAYRAGAKSPHIHVDGIGLSDDFKEVKGDSQKSSHSEWLENYYEALERSSENDIVRSHDEKHEGNLPIWAAVELLELGKLSSLYRGFEEQLATQIAGDYGVRATFLKGVNASLNDLRNHVAHQSRIWNFHYPINPPNTISKLPPQLVHIHQITDYERHKLFTRLSLLLWLDEGDRFGIEFSKRLLELLLGIPNSDSISYESMGFTSHFKDSYLWQGFEPRH